jgi:Ca-activated chloride channel family protein
MPKGCRSALLLYKAINSASVSEVCGIFFKKDTWLKLVNIISSIVYVILKTSSSRIKTSHMKKMVCLAIPLLFVLIGFHPSTSFVISGKIFDDRGSPIPFATVLEKGTRSGTLADSTGFFKLTVQTENAILIISAVGFESKEIQLHGQTIVSVTLKSASPQNLESLVITTGINGRSKSKMVDYLSYSPRERQIDNGLFHHDSIFDFNTENYGHIVENPFLKVNDNPLSTFSIDVDAASYSNVRRFLNYGQLPPPDAVRIEEMVNYFHYDYPQPAGEDPFTVNTELSDCPWNKDHKLVLVGLQGKKVPVENLPLSNLIFLIDVSGSMMEEDKLPLVKASMKLLVDQLRQDDNVAIVTYAGRAGLALPSTNGSEKTEIKSAIDGLEAGGSTAGGAGIKLAYKIAKENFIANGNNRVILCTDGDFNVGVSSDGELVKLIEEERKSGVFLSVLGFGTGNYQDNKMQQLADKGNGNHAYIDGLNEAKKVLVSEFGGTLFTIAKDVKLQIEFNPVKVQGYRLIGYENRLLNKEDFNDDKKDAGELGSGHTVTALYEIIPAGVKDTFMRKVDDLKYQKNNIAISNAANSGEVMTIKLRYKKPDGDVSKLIEQPVFDKQLPLSSASKNFRFAAAVAEFGILLRQSEFKSNASFENAQELASNAKGGDEEGYRSEFIKLIKKAQSLTKARDDVSKTGGKK